MIEPIIKEMIFAMRLLKKHNYAITELVLKLPNGDRIIIQ